MNRIHGWSNRLRNAHSDHHAIALGMAWVSLFVLLASLARAAREMVIAYRYGVSAEVDAYLFVFTLVNWPIAVWFSVLTVVLVPFSARIRRESPAEMPKFRSELLGLALIVGVTLALIVAMGLPHLIKLSWAGLDADTAAIAMDMVPTLALLAPAGVLVGLFSAWMLASSRHVNTLLESVPALVLIVALVIFIEGGIGPLVWGTVAGFFLHVISLVIPLKYSGEIEMPRFSYRSSQWSPFLHGFGLMLAGQVLMSFVGVVDQFFAAHLGTGAIATLGYANRILMLILSVGALAVSRATLPIFSQAQVRGESIDHARRVAIWWLRLLFVIGTFAVLTGWWLAPGVIELLFERGEFTSQDTLAVTKVFRYGLVQVPFYFSGLVLVSLLASQRRHKLIAIGAGINMFVKIGANFLLVPFMGINGIVTATTIMYVASFVVLYSFITVSIKNPV